MKILGTMYKGKSREIHTGVLAQWGVLGEKPEVVRNCILLGLRHPCIHLLIVIRLNARMSVKVLNA